MVPIYTEPPKPTQSDSKDFTLYKLGRIFGVISVAIIVICFCAVLLAVTARVICWLLGLGF